MKSLLQRGFSVCTVLGRYVWTRQPLICPCLVLGVGAVSHVKSQSSLLPSSSSLSDTWLVYRYHPFSRSPLPSNSPSQLVSSFQARNMLNVFYLEKETTLTSAFPCPFFFLPFLEKLLEYLLFGSLLFHLPFATVPMTLGGAVTYFSKECPFMKIFLTSPSTFPPFMLGS